MSLGQTDMIAMGFIEEKQPVGTHMCMIYNNDEERLQQIFKFLAAGLIDNEKVDYLVDTVSPDEFKSAFLAHISEELKASPKLQNLDLWSAEKTYCPHGRFVPDEMLHTLKTLYVKGREKGFSNCRASGEMTWSLRGIPGSDRLMEYEALINEVVVTHPITALCQYDAGRFDGKTIFDVLRVHPKVIVHGQVIQNPFYLKPRDFLKDHVRKNQDDRI